MDVFDEDPIIRGLNGATAQLYGGDEPVPDGHYDLVASGGGHTAGIVMPAGEVAKLTGQLSDILRSHYTQGVVAGVLTQTQQDAIADARALNVEAWWFVGTPAADGAVEVLALGSDFIWSFRIEANGESSSSEAKVGAFSTGIDC